jgi:hypothetical protein
MLDKADGTEMLIRENTTELVGEGESQKLA